MLTWSISHPELSSLHTKWGLQELRETDMKWAKTTTMFSPLPQPRHRSAAFAIGFGLQSTAIVILWTLAASAPRVVQKQFAYMELTAPRLPVEWQQPAAETPVEAPKPVRRLETARPRVAAHVLSAPVAAPSLEVATEIPIQPRPEPREVVPAPQEPPQVQRQVRATDFGSPATPTLPKMASKKVQTGGFGDYNGVASSVQANSGKVLTIATIGSFDLPAGPGYGNGSGGARGLRGVIPNAGFGNGVVTDARPAPRGHVLATSFGVSAPEPEIKRPAPLPQPTVVPVAIREKPSPLYTREARELGVEGEVLLQVVFASNGCVQVLRVVRGLGHGLDEEAVRAAEGIRFSPAQREGQAVDTRATVHIIFQLS